MITKEEFKLLKEYFYVHEVSEDMRKLVEKINLIVTLNETNDELVNLMKESEE